jgi:arylformamidase
MTPPSLIDISRAIRSGAPIYPGDPPVRLARVAAIGPDCPYQLSTLSGSAHLLTHIDAPAHFVAGGATIDQIPLERFLGPALVVEVAGDAIGPADLPPAADLRGVGLLFKTRHSAGPLPAAFDERHVHLVPAAARALAAAGVNLVGIDYLDLERPGDPAYPVHRILLEAGVLILEGLDLSAAAPGRYTLAALPLKLAGAEAAPCRAVLLA